MTGEVNERLEEFQLLIDKALQVEHALADRMRDLIAYGRPAIDPSTGTVLKDSEGNTVHNPPSAADLREARSWLKKYENATARARDKSVEQSVEPAEILKTSLIRHVDLGGAIPKLPDLPPLGDDEDDDEP